MMYRDRYGRFISYGEHLQLISRTLIDDGWSDALQNLSDACRTKAADMCRRCPKAAREWLDRADRLDALRS